VVQVHEKLPDNVKYWEIIADNLTKAGWNWGCVSAVDSSGRTIWIVDAHRDDRKRFVARADDKLTVFVEIEAAIQAEASAASLRLLKQSPYLSPVFGNSEATSF
jgi:hypothetical protein